MGKKTQYFPNAFYPTFPYIYGYTRIQCTAVITEERDIISKMLGLHAIH